MRQFLSFSGGLKEKTDFRFIADPFVHRVKDKCQCFVYPNSWKNGCPLEHPLTPLPEVGEAKKSSPFGVKMLCNLRSI